MMKEKLGMPATYSDDEVIDGAMTKMACNRRFIELVRAKLDAAGNADIPVSRRWIDEDDTVVSFQLNVPVGSGLIVPLRARHSWFAWSEDAEFLNQADHFAQALVTLRQAERVLVEYASNVERAAGKVVAEARADGLDLLLADVGFRPIYVWQLTGRSWEEAASQILASVTVRHTSSYLRPQTSKVYVKGSDHVAEALAGILNDQRQRQARLEELDEIGADLLTDAITLDLLRMHVSDVAEVLRHVWKSQHVAIPIKVDGHATQLCLTTVNGTLESSVKLDGAHWNGEHMWLIGDQIEHGLDLVGKTLAGKVKHPAFARRTVMHIDRRPPDIDGQILCHFDMSPTFLFDADTGRIWPKAERAAA